MNKMALSRLMALALPVLLLVGVISPKLPAQAHWRLKAAPGGVPLPSLPAQAPTPRHAGHLFQAAQAAFACHRQLTVTAQPPDAGLPASPEQAAPKVPGIPPQVGLAPYSLMPRNTLGFFGSGFPPDTWVDVRLGNLDGMRPVDRYSIWLGRGITNAGGNLNGQVEVPLLPAGDYPVYFVPAGSRTPVVANLIIQALKPWVVLDQYAPDPQYWMGFQGRDFAPDEVVQVYLNQQRGQPVARVQADGYGNFTLNRVWEVPNLTGDNALIFVGKDSGATFTARFEMMPQQPKPALAQAPAQRLPAETAALRSGVLSGGQRWQLASSLPPGSPLQGTSSTFMIGLLLLIVWLMLVVLLSVVMMLRRGGRQRPQKIVGEEALLVHDSASTQAGLAGLFAVPPAASSPTSLGAPNEAAQQQISFCPRCGWPYVAGGTPHPPFATQPPPSATPTQPRKTPAKLVIHREVPTTLGMWVGAASDRGRKRAGRENEDNFLAARGTRKDHGALQPFGLFVVADGMGGRANGHDASRIVIETIFHHLASSLMRDDLSSDDLLLLLEEAIQGANEALYRHNQQGGAYMGSTVTAALITGSEAMICSIGDSRTYLLRPQQSIRRVTVDHSIVESLVAAGAIQRDDVYTHPRRDRIYRSLGQRLLAQIDTFREPLGPGDELLLCCDGLWELIRDPDIERILRQYADVRQASGKLIERANENGGDDNITALVVKLTDEVKPARRAGIEQIDSGPADLSRSGFAG